MFKFFVKEGQQLQPDEIITEIETHKKLVEIQAPTHGYVSKFLVQPPKVVDVGAEICEFVSSEPTTPTSKPTNSHQPSTTPTPQPIIIKPTQSESIPLVQPTFVRKEWVERLSKLRQIVSERLKDAQNTCALLTTFQEVNMENLIQIKEQNQDEFLKKHGVKLGYMSFFAKASTLALQQQLLFNAYIKSNTEVLYRNYIDISIAVSTPRGLVVPVLKNTHQMGLHEVEKNISVLAQKARDNKLDVEDMIGGTFTISNGGVYGSLLGTPIVNLPQSAILGMHSIQKRAVVVNDQIVIQRMMNLALTYDHRLLDGRDAVIFLNTIKGYIENPTRMMLGL